MSTQPHTVLITGANSGLGFESAARFAELGAARIILVTRSAQKGEAAREALRARVGRDPFETLTIDLAEVEAVERALAELGRRGGSIDALLLNAGVAGGETPRRSPAGVELGFASSLLGHHALTVGLLEAGLLSAEARIVIASAEAVRGDLSMMMPVDVAALAEEHFDGDRSAAVSAIARIEPPYAYAATPHYTTVKLIAAWWARALSERLPAGMAVFAVSPGTTPGTGAGRNQGWLVRRVVMPLMAGPLGRMTGMSHSVRTAAERYVRAVGWDAARSGQLWTSKLGKTTGPLEEMRQEHVRDPDAAEATWRELVRLTGVGVSRGIGA